MQRCCWQIHFPQEATMQWYHQIWNHYPPHPAFQNLRSDAGLQKLEQTIINGCYNDISDIPKPHQKYWNHHNILMAEDDMILYSEVLLIPQWENGILEAIHQVHQRIMKCQLRSYPVYIHWPGMNTNIQHICRVISHIPAPPDMPASRTSYPNTSAKPPLTDGCQWYLHPLWSQGLSNVF